jgi:hypothetical protein
MFRYLHGTKLKFSLKLVQENNAFSHSKRDFQRPEHEHLL